MNVSERKKVRSSHPKITEFLRGEIVRGRLKPGSLLPPRLQLLKQFDAAPATIQEAIHQLRAEGFVETSSPRKGTRVVEFPPNLYHFKIIFPPSMPPSSPYYGAIMEAASRIQAKGKCYFSVFNGVHGPKDLEMYESLLKELDKNRIAGLFFATSGSEFRGTPLFDKPGIPRFAIAPASLAAERVSKAMFDLQSFFKLAGERVVAEEKKRVFVLNRADFLGEPLEGLLDKEMRSKELEIPRYWVQFVSQQDHAIERCLRLVFQGGKETPDALLITDDHLVETATKILKRMEGVIPKDLLVLAHANFPKPTPSHVPAVRIGFDVSEMLQRGMDNLFAEQNGSRPPNFQLIKAVCGPK